MNIIFFISGFAVVVLMAFFAFVTAKINSTNIDFFEKLCRNRKIGVIIGFPLLCWCVPHAQAIIFSWAEAYLWYAAVILAILSYFYLDYLTARAMGGLFIVGAYMFVHWGYEFQVPLAPAMTIMAWFWGIIGICISGKPSFLRDYFRKCAAMQKLKTASYIFFALTAGFFAISTIGELLK